MPAFEPDPPLPPVTEEERAAAREHVQMLKAALEEHDARLNAYHDCPPRFSEAFPRWLHDRAQAREAWLIDQTASMAKAPTHDETAAVRGWAEVVPLRPGQH